MVLFYLFIFNRLLVVGDPRLIAITKIKYRHRVVPRYFKIDTISPSSSRMDEGIHWESSRFTDKEGRADAPAAAAAAAAVDAAVAAVAAVARVHVGDGDDVGVVGVHHPQDEQEVVDALAQNEVGRRDVASLQAEEIRPSRWVHWGIVVFKNCFLETKL